MTAPGLIAAAGVAAVATLLGRQVPIIGGPPLAIVIGVVVAAAVRRRGSIVEAIRPGLDVASKHILQFSVVVLGFGLSLRQVVTIGAGSLPVLVGTLASALLVARIVGRRLGLGHDLTVLIGAGTAICGASAIAAVDSVVDADDADVSYAITTIFAFNVVAVLLYPSLGHLLGLSQHSFGLFAGTAINDTSSVVAAATVYGHGALQYAVVVKLTRTLAIVPVCAALARMAGRGRTQSRAPAHARVSHIVPYFLMAFVAAAALNSVGLVPRGLHPGLSTLATWLITVALAGVGLSTRFDRIRSTGPRPFVLGAVLWATVGLTSMALQVATGTA